VPGAKHPPATLVEVVAALEDRPEGSLSVYDRRGRRREVRSYPEVARRARAWGARLRAEGVRPGEVVFLCLPTSHDLIEAFLGATLLGALPCCLALPRAIGGLDVFRRRLGLLGERFPGGHLVTLTEVGAELGGAEPGGADGRAFLDVAAIRDGLDLDDPIALEPVGPDALAYVQLTSGSTTTPKAVAISHGNLAANTGGIYGSGEGRLDEVYVSWLPLYHDMGLVGIVLTALFQGPSLVLMPPEAFVGTPLKWLQAISEVEVGHVGTSAPNFGYQWCLDRIRPEKLEGLDLSRWRIACCGAEMVRPETLSAFQARFAPFGFREGTFVPCYGMAETTLAITMCPPQRAPRLHQGRVSCGPPIPGLELTVRPAQTDPDVAAGAPLPDGEEGEVVVRGSSLFQGYHRDPEATAAVVRDGWFHTGDLGLLHEGELYVTGRLKDLIILDGANVAPHELEWIAEAHVDVEGGRAAAFSVEQGGREVPVLVVEAKEVPPAAVLEAVDRQAASDIAPLHDLVVVRRGTLPKTSSGKVQRHAVRAAYLAGTLEALWSRRASEPVSAEEQP